MEKIEIRKIESLEPTADHKLGLILLGIAAIIGATLGPLAGFGGVYFMVTHWPSLFSIIQQISITYPPLL